MGTKSMKVVLWNPVSNQGHLNLYLELYAKALIDIGCDVFYYGQFNREFNLYLHEKLPLLKAVEEINAEQPLVRWSTKWIALVSKNIIKNYSNVLNRIYVQVLNKLLNFYKLNRPPVGFDILARKLQDLRDSGFKADLVICMYLDITYLDRKSLKQIDNVGTPWIGLLFHPEPHLPSGDFNKYSWFSSKTNRGGIFFVDKFAESYSKLSRENQIFSTFPDVTRTIDHAKHENDFDFRQMAKGRTIIGLVGALDGRKKMVNEFLEISYDSRLTEFFFVLAGEVYESTFSEFTLSELRRLSGHVNENLFVFDQYVESEQAFDTIISNIDLIFACYKNFDSSANILAKSAIFKKPLLVTAGTLIGKTVEAYNLGLALNNPDVKNIPDALIQLKNRFDLNPDSFDFTAYANEVSPEKLKINLENLLNQLVLKDLA